jgi:L-ornithine Nalpha-acyltransferase
MREGSVAGSFSMRTLSMAPPLHARGSVLAVRRNLSVVIASEPEDVLAAKKLRYRIFYEEMHACPDGKSRITRRDEDAFDAFCDHLLVLDEESPGTVVGTYRVLPQTAAMAKGGYYSAREFDLDPLLQRHPQLNFLELGRSCILGPYRTGAVIELLWQGIWNYVRLNAVDVMFGCASLEGVDPAAHAVQLSFLAQNFTAPAPWKVHALKSRFVPMNRLAAGSYDAKQAARKLPPLLKGYLRIGAFTGDGAVVDHQFNSTDVFVVLPVTNIRTRYFSRFGAPGEQLSC